MTDSTNDDGYDPDVIAAAQARLQKARAEQAKAADPAPLAGAIATAGAAMERLWERGALPDDAEGRAAHDRAIRVSELEEARDQVPPHFRGRRAELAAHIDPKLLRAVEGWRWGDDNLLLLGATQKGKTTAAAYLVRSLLGHAVQHGGEALEKAKLIRWQSCRELTFAIRESRLGEGAPDAIIRCQNARLLVLDDLGLSDDKAALERILDVRYLRSWPTITTSGLRYRELLNTFGEALVRRIVETKGRGGRIIQAFPAEAAA